MVKPRSEEVLNEGGGSYLSIEKAMKKKKKRKSPPSDNEASNMVASRLAKVVPIFRPCVESDSTSAGSQVAPFAGAGLVFKAGGSGSGSMAKSAGPNVKRPKPAGSALQRAKKAFPRGSGVGLGAGPVPNRPNPPTPLPIRPEAAVPGAVPAGPPEGTKMRVMKFHLSRHGVIV
ncbi:hypothetical protein LIER_35204 [Lithospermum erythrorhizon]|uniref:Uncharacterized protein n=1 Tax=Lithospermum erythrorhizon TaxID=34254 RepID=A0AAV3NM73_LITER